MYLFFIPESASGALTEPSQLSGGWHVWGGRFLDLSPPPLHVPDGIRGNTLIAEACHDGAVSWRPLLVPLKMSRFLHSQGTAGGLLHGPCFQCGPQHVIQEISQLAVLGGVDHPCGRSAWPRQSVSKLISKQCRKAQ